MDYKDTTSKKNIYETLKSDILQAKYPPGSVLKEVELAKRFNISRTPLREVIKRLALEQYIDVIPRHGNRVSLINLKYVKQLMEMRIVLESTIIKNIIMAPEVINLDCIKENLDKQLECVNSNNIKDFFIYDEQFHYMLFELDDKLIWWQSIKQFDTHYTRYRSLDMLENVDLNMLYTHHKNIYQAMVNMDIISAVEVLKSHLGLCFKRMPHLIQKYPKYFIKNN